MPFNHDGEELANYFVNGTLVIRVDGTCYPMPYSDTTLALKPCKVPLNDVIKELHSMYNDEMFADTTIASQGKEFKAHKFILASRSPVFRKMFEVDMKLAS